MALAEFDMRANCDKDYRVTGDSFHLWTIAPSPSQADELRTAELARYQRMTHPESRRDFAASQAGLRAVLSRYLKCPADSVSLLRRERGKPFLSEGPEFNLSHSGGTILLAVAGQPVGLDVEVVGRRVNFARLAGKFFSPLEQTCILSVRPSRRNHQFLRHWVCKEAVVKLSGDGIYHGLRDAEIFLDRYRTTARYRGREVSIREFRPAEGFMAALASWRPLRAGGRFSL